MKIRIKVKHGSNKDRNTDTDKNEVCISPLSMSLSASSSSSSTVFSACTKPSHIFSHTDLWREDERVREEEEGGGVRVKRMTEE
jgi:hypothetical protein